MTIHARLAFAMPASAEVVFDAFHYHHWRHQWDSLVGETRIVGGGECPHVGAVTENAGAGWMRALAMRTRFLSFDRPRVAAAAMLGTSFPFTQWAASMRHRAASHGGSVLVYTYRFEVGPAAWAWLLEPVTSMLFAWQTRRRFARLRRFLAHHAADIERWQQLRHAELAR